MKNDNISNEDLLDRYMEDIYIPDYNLDDEAYIPDENLTAQFMANIASNKSNETPIDTRYNYPYVELEEVIANPSEYIIPQCLPACASLWSKNIETFMVSNNQDDDIYVLIRDLSSENMAIFNECQKQDSRYFFDAFRNTIGIVVKGNSESSMNELEKLTQVFKIQDTVRFETSEEFLESYKYNSEPEASTVTLEEALRREVKESLYIASEDRVYESPMYLSWHQRYNESLKNNLNYPNDTPHR